MKSNFQFLEQQWPEFYNRSSKAEQFAKTDPRTSLVYARMALEVAIIWMFANDDELEAPFDSSLHNLMVQESFKAQFNHKLYNELHLIRKTGNLATHNKPVSDVDSLTTIEYLYYFSKWFAKSYSENNLGTIGIFDFHVIPQEDVQVLARKQVDGLQQKLDNELLKFQKALDQAQIEKEALAEKNTLYKQQLNNRQRSIVDNKEIANLQDQEPNVHPRNEAETRKQLIDVMLREAGWDLQGANDREFKVNYMPKSTNVSETGYVDYVLWDDDGLPLALVEAKRTLENVSKGENQAQLYADSLEKMFGRRPIMYYSNGYETYLWDDQFYKQSRPVHGFYTKGELQTQMFRRENRKDIRLMPIDLAITDRKYQMRAIRSISEHFAGTDKQTGKLIGTNRSALLVLATGTGKTRTSIAFSKVLLEANWAKRILFLADRKSLVSQAKSNFVKHLPQHVSVNLLEEKDNMTARFTFSTYNTMMRMIDNAKDNDRRFYGVGHFDLIIIDEAHRSIYKKYQAIFEYFDALFLGLTATPIEQIDRNTFEAFDLPDKSPTDAYTFDEAVSNKHLVPYRSIEVPTKFLRQGIKYDELSDKEKEEFEKEILDGDEAKGTEWIGSEALNKWLFNKDTAIKTLQFIVKHGIKKRGGEELGKTIIFAKNKKHAQFLKKMFLTLDKERYGNDYVKVITHGEPKAQEFIRRFCDEEKDRLPQIAISVDMLDTGIDAPSCVNLVFYKPVKSFAKFWQMIGRGSRLRPNLFGQGQDKERFVIFDLCGNFEFFKQNPKGIESSSQKSLMEIVFELKLQLAQYLKEKQFQDDEYLQKFRQDMLDELHGMVSSLEMTRYDVNMRLKIVHEYGGENRELWNHLTKKDIRLINDKIAPLIKPKKGDSDLARFYDKMIYVLMIKRLETPNTPEFKESFTTPITKVALTSKRLLNKTSIPEVKKNEAIIKLPLEEQFWSQNGIKHLEKIRQGIRNLTKYIDPEDQKYVTTDFEDYLQEDRVVINDYVGETTGATGSSPFKNNINRLEEIIRSNEDNLTISRIRNGETITSKELESLENMLFDSIEQKEALESELGLKLNLVEFIVSLIGLSSEHVNLAFVEFINTYQLNSKQIQFIDTLKKFLLKNGKVNPEKLYDSPFKSFHSMGVDGVFNEEQADVIFSILKNFNNRHSG